MAKSTPDVIEVRPSAAKNIITRAFQAKRPLFLWGPPGIGKSEIVEGIARSGAIGKATVIDLRLALMEPTDLRGFPMVAPDTQEMIWAPARELPTEAMASEYDTVVLFLDELNSAPPSVQAAAYQLILNRRIGEYRLPDNVVVIAAGNRDTDRGVTFRMPTPLANRFRHLNMVVEFEDWQSWAINSNIHPDVIGYLTYAKGDLFQFDPKTASQAFATPRSWTFVSELLYVDGFDSAPKTEQFAEVTGAVGQGIAHKFIEHRRIAGKMPIAADILSGKVTKLNDDLKREISAMYSLTVNMAYEIQGEYKREDRDDEKFGKKLNNMIRFAFDNFQPEMVILLLKTVLTEYKVKFNIRRDLDKDVRDTFQKRYMEFILD
jgi:hypothetical protein